MSGLHDALLEDILLPQAFSVEYITLIKSGQSACLLKASFENYPECERKRPVVRPKDEFLIDLDSLPYNIALSSELYEGLLSWTFEGTSI